MDKKKFNAMCQAIRDEVIGIYETAVQMEKDGIYDVQEYVKLGLPHPTGYYQSYSMFKKVTIDSDSLGGDNFDRDILAIREFEKKYNETNGIGKSYAFLDGTAYDDTIDYVYYTFSYYTLTDQNIEGEIKRRIRDAVAERLAPEGQSPRTPDCSMLELFKDGKIDWDTLRQITYKDCKL